MGHLKTGSYPITLVITGDEFIMAGAAAPPASTLGTHRRGFTLNIRRKEKEKPKPTFEIQSNGGVFSLKNPPQESIVALVEYYKTEKGLPEASAIRMTLHDLSLVIVQYPLLLKGNQELKDAYSTGHNKLLRLEKPPVVQPYILDATDVVERGSKLNPLYDGSPRPKVRVLGAETGESTADQRPLSTVTTTRADAPPTPTRDIARSTSPRPPVTSAHFEDEASVAVRNDLLQTVWTLSKLKKLSDRSVTVVSPTLPEFDVVAAMRRGTVDLTDGLETAPPVHTGFGSPHDLEIDRILLDLNLQDLAGVFNIDGKYFLKVVGQNSNQDLHVFTFEVCQREPGTPYHVDVQGVFRGKFQTAEYAPLPLTCDLFQIEPTVVASDGGIKIKSRPLGKWFEGKLPDLLIPLSNLSEVAV